ncbi:MAG: hypothetical protein KC535_02240 [Nanoarchaeota archaeon]|nr:hypothetical protein [Nanoarchaeota archaeon]
MQDQTDISESYTAEQTTVITLLNDQPRSQNVIIQIAPDSQYLLAYLDIEDTTLTLIPGEKKNVLLNTYFPEEGLSPETHYIDIIARSDDDRSVARTQVVFTVPGTATPHLNILSESFNLNSQEKTIGLDLENDGNVILRPQINIIISQGTETIKTINYKTPLQILPGEVYPLNLRIDTTSLQEGNYEVSVDIHARDGIELSTEKKPFDVLEEGAIPQKNEQNNTPFIIAGIFVILVTALLSVNAQLKRKDDPLTKKIRFLEKKEKLLEKELQKLIKDTHQVVDTSNKWIRSNLGEEYELR